jgi:hypothetical protein
MGQGNERRDSERFALFEYAIVRLGAQSIRLRSVVVDVSLGGLQVRSREEFESGIKCILCVGRIGMEPMEIGAEVRYSRPIEGSDLVSTGFRIIPSSDIEKEQWARFVQNSLKHSGESLAS